MCGVQTPSVVLPPPTPTPAATAVFASRLQMDAGTGTDVQAGQRGPVRGINDLRLTPPTLTTG